MAVRIVPALADLTQDIAGPIPVELLHNWAGGRQDRSAAEELLLPFRIDGTVVSTDTSGLSRLTQERDLLDVLALISRPKQIVHALGIEIGGRPIGTWVADNTEMYYPVAVAADSILDAMAEVHFRVARAAPVQIGMCVHAGLFYEIGGGLYGRDALTVEFLAEECADAGEILITRETLGRIAEPGAYETRPKWDVDARLGPGVLTVRPRRRTTHLRGDDTRYPHAFTREFYDLFSSLDGNGDAGRLKDQIYAAYQRERTIVFLAREREAEESDDLTATLDNLLLDALMDTVVRDTAGGGGQLSSSGGGLAILTFTSPRDALEFALSARGRFVENALAVQTGIDHGAVLVFEEAGRRSGIAGDPVNLASKISETAGEPGKIQITARTAERLPSIAGAEPFELQISGIRVAGVTL